MPVLEPEPTAAVVESRPVVRHQASEWQAEPEP
eukprot:COSAG03_NODE_26421_length_259_cov_0.650000_2_plen_32_part_01